MLSPSLCLLVLSLANGILGAPVRTDTPDCIIDPECGPIPGGSSLYSDDISKKRPFPADVTAAILPTTNGSAGEDDVLFQNLLSAEWAVFSFYQEGVEAFNESSFTDLGLPSITYQKITRSATMKQATCAYSKILFHRLPLSQDLAIMIICGTMLLQF